MKNVFICLPSFSKGRNRTQEKERENTPKQSKQSKQQRCPTSRSEIAFLTRLRQNNYNSKKHEIDLLSDQCHRIKTNKIDYRILHNKRPGPFLNQNKKILTFSCYYVSIFLQKFQTLLLIRCNLQSQKEKGELTRGGALITQNTVVISAETFSSFLSVLSILPFHHRSVLMISSLFLSSFRSVYQR